MRRSLALYIELGVQARRIDPATRILVALLPGFFSWRDALVVISPGTLIRWHLPVWRLCRQLKSQLGPPQTPTGGVRLIVAEYSLLKHHQ